MPTVDAPSRTALQLVGAHVLGRRRFEVTGRFGLRATPGGFGTPAFGEGPEVVRVSGTDLVREVAGWARAMGMEGRSLRDLATFVGTELGGGFSTGPDTPKVEDPDTPLRFDAPTADVLARWFALGWSVVDALMARLPAQAEPATLQLWPEHFDAGTNVAVPGGERANIGFSPGDTFEPDPYLYIGPWGPGRPGEAEFWNAPFGAVLGCASVWGEPDSAARCLEFLGHGLRLLSDGRTW